MTRRAVIQVPAFQEGAMRPVLDAIASQQAPDGWSVGYECWVTPTSRSPADDLTFQIADRHPTFRARVAPDGFVSTLNAMHGEAFDGGVDAVVKWDADAPPAREDVLATLLAWAGREDVAAVNSRPLSQRPITGWMHNAATLVTRSVVPHLHGQCYAMTPRGWDGAGPYNEDLDQTNSWRVWTEVERRMFNRLTAAGVVVKPKDAVVANDPRRSWCSIERALAGVSRAPRSEWCEARGVETFEMVPRGPDYLDGSK